MGKFKIPTVSSTTNKTVRFTNNKIYRFDKAIQGKDCTFPAFVISAFRAALKKYDKDESGNVRKEYKFRLRKESVEE